MSISARIPGTELQSQMNSQFGGAFLEGVLIDADGVTFDPTLSDSASRLFVTSNEVPTGQGGYQRQVIGWAADSAGAYTDDGVAMDQRYIVYEQDGNTPYGFTHLALVKGGGNLAAGGTATSAPVSADNGTYLNLPFTASAGGSGGSLDVVVTNNGATAADYAIAINSPGTGYSVGEILSISTADLTSAGMNPGNTASVTFTVADVYDPADSGAVVSVAQLDGRTVLDNGNSAAFYVNLKLFGFYSV